MWQIGRIICLGYLAGMSVADIQFRRLSNALLIMGSILAVGYSVCVQDVSVEQVIAGAAIGAVFFLISYVTREALGYGDSWIICILGVYLGAAELVEILLVAGLTASMAAILCLVRRRMRRRTALPFVPFITLGYVVVFAAGVMGG